MKNILGMMLLCLSLLAGTAWAAPVNINSADAHAFETAIKGVGEKKALAIVKYRKEHGPFRSVDDLAKVPGIGVKTIAKNRANLTVGKSAKEDSTQAANSQDDKTTH